MTIPTAHRPSASALAGLTDCDSEALYYGIGRPADFAGARGCAYLELDRDGASVFGGATILMMIYANGKGVPVDLDLAMKFACATGGAPAELEGRLRELASRAKISAKDFEFCEHVTSGLMASACAAHEERMSSLQRDARRAAASAGLPRPELRSLQRAAAAFFDARERNEVDLSGTARAAFAIAERANLEEDLVRALEQIADSSFPPDAGAARTEAELNRVYASLMSCRALVNAARVLPGSVMAAGVRRTQRLWLPYRDAWLALARKVRPDSRPERWRAWLNRERTKMLLELASEC